MVSNIKTEIIYYCGPTDFEFEFNLSGSCNMRLLTNVANDNASLLKALQRSISRSKVILIIGNIKGENSIISLVSKSIGYAEQKLDTNIYNVNGADDVIIVNGSVPLITDNGDFGGCIIESGPQSMIFLTEDKKIRKEIMNQLVHAYINELSRYPSPIPTKNTEPENTEITEEVTVPTEEGEITLEIEEEISDPEVTEEQIEKISEEEQPEDLKEVTDEMIKEVNFDNSEKDPYNIDNIVNNNADVDEIISEPTVFEDDDYEENIDEGKRLKKNKSLDIITLVISILLLIVLAFVIYSLFYRPLTNGISIEENFRNIFSFLNL